MKLKYINIIFIIPILIFSLIAQGQVENDSIKSRWSNDITLSPNFSIHTIQDEHSGTPLNAFSSPYSFFYPFTNNSMFGLGLSYNERYKLSANTNFVTGLSLDEITYQGNWIRNGNFLFLSFGIPFLIETKTKINEKLSFHFDIGTELAFILNGQAIDETWSNIYSKNEFNLNSSGFIIYGIIGFGFNYKFDERMNLSIGPQFYQALISLEYLYQYIGPPDYDDEHILHLLQFIQFLNINYKF